MATQESYPIQGAVLRETEKAIHFRVDSVDGDALEDSVEEWFPKSQIVNHSADWDELEVKTWILSSKGLV